MSRSPTASIRAIKREPSDRKWAFYDVVYNGEPVPGLRVYVHKIYKSDHSRRAVHERSGHVETRAEAYYQHDNATLIATGTSLKSVLQKLQTYLLASE